MVASLQDPQALDPADGQDHITSRVAAAMAVIVGVRNAMDIN